MVSVSLQSISFFFLILRDAISILVGFVGSALGKAQSSIHGERILHCRLQNLLHGRFYVSFRVLAYIKTRQGNYPPFSEFLTTWLRGWPHGRFSITKQVRWNVCTCYVGNWEGKEYLVALVVARSASMGGDSGSNPGGQNFPLNILYVGAHSRLMSTIG